MHSCRPVRCAAFRFTRVSCFLVAVAAFALLSATDSSAQGTTTDPNVFNADVWTPRSRTGEIHLHGGVFAPIDAEATSATLGARIGIGIGSHALIGISGDWAFKSNKLLEPVQGALPGFEPEILLAQVDAHLVPAMLFVQVRLTDKFFLEPYAGAGAGYEWLILDAKDYRTDESWSATYSNWAWQGYAGLGLRLSQSTRLDGELFYNGGLLGRDVVDQSGDSWRETVDAEGVGARVGLNFVY
jgi:hypothetical protein